MRYSGRPIFKFAALLAVLTLLWVLLLPPPHKEMFMTDDPGTLTCAINLNHDIRSSQSRNVGFHYELLNTFGENCGKHVSIIRPSSSPECWGLLTSDSIQLLVTNVNDSIPEEYSSLILMSVVIKGDDVWAVMKGNERLLNSINFWYAYLQGEGMFKTLSRNYFRSYKLEWLLDHKGEVSSISPYDGIIKKYSAQTGVDWRLVSAMVYQESQFKIGAELNSAMGLMQIKEKTARRYGVTDTYNPEMNVRAGTRHLDYLLKKYTEEGLDSADVIKFALMAYNVGEGAVEKKRHVADSLGFNPDNWNEVVMSVSHAKGSRQSIDYVEAVMETYEAYKTIIE